MMVKPSAAYLKFLYNKRRRCSTNFGKWAREAVATGVSPGRRAPRSRKLDKPSLR